MYRKRYPCQYNYDQQEETAYEKDIQNSGIFRNVRCDGRGISLPAAAGESFSDSIEIKRTEEYTFDPEEIMYLSGVRFLANTPGARYTLRDLNEDGISELFVSAGD